MLDSKLWPQPSNCATLKWQLGDVEKRYPTLRERLPKVFRSVTSFPLDVAPDAGHLIFVNRLAGQHII